MKNFNHIKIISESSQPKSFPVAIGFKNESEIKAFTKKEFLKLLIENGYEDYIKFLIIKENGKVQKRISKYKLYNEGTKWESVEIGKGELTGIVYCND